MYIIVINTQKCTFSVLGATRWQKTKKEKQKKKNQKQKPGTAVMLVLLFLRLLCPVCVCVCCRLWEFVKRMAMIRVKPAGRFLGNGARLSVGQVFKIAASLASPDVNTSREIPHSFFGCVFSLVRGRCLRAITREGTPPQGRACRA